MSDPDSTRSTTEPNEPQDDSTRRDDSTQRDDSTRRDDTTTQTASQAKPDEKRPPWGSKDDFDPDRAWNLIQNLRNDLDKKSQKLDTIERSQESEQQRLERERDEALKSRDSTSVELARMRAALKHGLDDDDLDLLGTGTDDEIDERAKRLAERIGTTKKAPASRRPREQMRGGGEPEAEPDETDLRKLGARMFTR